MFDTLLCSKFGLPRSATAAANTKTHNNNYDNDYNNHKSAFFRAAP